MASTLRWLLLNRALPLKRVGALGGFSQAVWNSDDDGSQRHHPVTARRNSRGPNDDMLLECVVMAELEGYVRVMPEAEVAEGQLYGFEVDDELRILTRVGGEILALYGICSHEYAELVDGEVDDGILWCPLHSSGFEVHTGQATNLPAVLPIAVYDVQIVAGEVYVAVAPKYPDE